MKKYSSFRPGQVWFDTDGNRIQAHEGLPNTINQVKMQP